MCWQNGRPRPLRSSACGDSAAVGLRRVHSSPEESGSWAIVRRERLHDHFLDALPKLARRFEAQHAWQAALRCYRRALESEPLRQDFWYRLMVCHKQLGQPAEALAVYRRCRHFLSGEPGGKPSAEIEALRTELGSIDASA